MPSYKEHYGSRYLSAQDVPDSGIKTQITDVYLGERERDDGEIQHRLVATLDGVQKPLLLNTTNANVLGELLGEDYEQWAGARCVLRRVKVDFAGKRVDGIRITNVERV